MATKSKVQRKGYKEFFIAQLQSPKSRAQLNKAFQKKYPQDTKTMIAEEKAVKETNRYLHFLNKENLLSSKKDPNSTRGAKLYFMTATQTKNATELNILRSSTLAGQARMNGKPAPKKAAKKATKKSAKPAAKKATAKSNKPIAASKGKKFF